MCFLFFSLIDRWVERSGRIIHVLWMKRKSVLGWHRAQTGACKWFKCCGVMMFWSQLQQRLTQLSVSSRLSDAPCGQNTNTPAALLHSDCSRCLNKYRLRTYMCIYKEVILNPCILMRTFTQVLHQNVGVFVIYLSIYFHNVGLFIVFKSTTKSNFSKSQDIVIKVTNSTNSTLVKNLQLFDICLCMFLDIVNYEFNEYQT